MFNTILYHENFIIFKPRQTFSFDVVIKYVTVLSGKYLANFTRIPDSAGCLNFTGFRILVSGSGTSLVTCGSPKLENSKLIIMYNPVLNNNTIDH